MRAGLSLRWILASLAYVNSIFSWNNRIQKSVCFSLESFFFFKVSDFCPFWIAPPRKILGNCKREDLFCSCCCAIVDVTKVWLFYQTLTEETGTQHQICLHKESLPVRDAQFFFYTNCKMVLVIRCFPQGRKYPEQLWTKWGRRWLRGQWYKTWKCQTEKKREF